MKEKKKIKVLLFIFIVEPSKWNQVKIPQDIPLKSNQPSINIYRDDNNIPSVSIRRKLEYENVDNTDQYTINTKQVMNELSDLYSTYK